MRLGLNLSLCSVAGASGLKVKFVAAAAIVLNALVGGPVPAQVTFAAASSLTTAQTTGVVESATFVALSGLTASVSTSPSVSSITPSSGPTVGGTTITNLAGTGFVNGCTVTIGGAAATSVVFVSSTKLTCVSPAGTAGAQNVVVTNPNGQPSGTSGASAYTFANVAEWGGLIPLCDWDMAQAVVTVGTSIDSIPDATLQGRTLTGVTSNKPTKTTASANFNSCDTAAFAGSSQQRFTFGDVGIANNGPFSIAIVAKVNTEDATNKWIMETTNQHIGIYGDVAGHHWHEWLNSGFTGVDMSTAPLITTSTVLLATLSSGTQRFYGNSATEKGNHASSGGTFSGGGVIGNNSTPGNGFSLNGEIARIIVFGQLLDSTQRTNVLNALGTKYGITIV